MKKIICICVNETMHYNFFKCFFRAIQNSGYEIIILCNSIPLYIKSKLDNMHTIPLVLKKNINNSYFKKICRKINFNELLEVLNKTHNVKYAQQLYYSVYNLLQNNLFKRVNYFFILGGDSTIDRAIKYFCSIKKIRTLFFDFSNLPNKTFIDPKGINANSFIFNNHRDILKKYPEVPDYLFADWINSYERYKQNKIPQANFNLSYKYLLGWLLSSLNLFFNFAYSKPTTFKNLLFDLKVYFNPKKNISFINNISLEGKKYIFAPLQVTTDSQIIINSNIDNIGLIKQAQKTAKNNCIDLYIKLHPAETNTEFINYIISKHNKDFIVVTNNTNDLIKNAIKIISINSTICLEAMFYKKDIEILGKSVYKNFSWDDTKKYVTHHLFDMYVFNPKELSTDNFKILLEKYATQIEV